MPYAPKLYRFAPKQRLVVPARVLKSQLAQRQSNAAGPQSGPGPLPDFQEIYYAPESEQRQRDERKANLERMRAQANRYKAAIGFHGGALDDSEPEVRYEANQPVVQDSKRGLKKPTIRSEKLMGRLEAGANRPGPDGPGADTAKAPRVLSKRKSKKRTLPRG